VGKRDVTFIVAGAGGYNQKLHILASQFHQGKPPFQMPGSDGTLESFCDSSHGYLLVDVRKKTIHGDYFAVPDVNPSIAKLPMLKSFDNFDIAVGG
jgi:hypothetical protein